MIASNSGYKVVVDVLVRPDGSAIDCAFTTRRKTFLADLPDMGKLGFEK